MEHVLSNPGKRKDINTTDGEFVKLVSESSQRSSSNGMVFADGDQNLRKEIHIGLTI